MKKKLIIKYVLKSILLRIEYDRFFHEELFQIGIEFVKLTEREITEEPEYKELLFKMNKLIGNI